MLSPVFKVAEYGIEEANYYPIRCAWTFFDENVNKDTKMEVEDSKNNPQKQTSILFDKGCVIPNVKSITFHREESVDFKLFYDSSPDGFEPLIAHFIAHNQKPKEPEFGMKLRIHLNKNGVAEFESAQLLEDYYEEVIAPPTPETTTKPDVNQANAQQKEQEAKKKKKTKVTNLKVDGQYNSGYPQQVIAKLYEEECHMAHQDKIIYETYDKKNELESYIYEMRGKLADKFLNYAPVDVKENLLNLLEQAESWLYQDGAKATKSAYANKIEGLRKIGDPITKRYNEFQDIPEAIQNFVNTLNGYEQILLSNVIVVINKILKMILG